MKWIIAFGSIIFTGVLFEILFWIPYRKKKKNKDNNR